jgi:hypothetical protein
MGSIRFHPSNSKEGLELKLQALEKWIWDLELEPSLTLELLRFDPCGPA